LLYVFQQIGTFVPGAVTLAMFGGELPWAEFFYAWFVFGFLLIGNVCNTVRAFIDSSVGREQAGVEKSPFLVEDKGKRLGNEPPKL